VYAFQQQQKLLFCAAVNVSLKYVKNGEHVPRNNRHANTYTTDDVRCGFNVRYGRGCFTQWNSIYLLSKVFIPTCINSVKTVDSPWLFHLQASEMKLVIKTVI